MSNVRSPFCALEQILATVGEPYCDFPPSSRTEPTSTKPIGARRDSLLHEEGVAHGWQHWSFWGPVQSWKPVSQQGSGVPALKGGGLGVFRISPRWGKFPALLTGLETLGSAAQKPWRTEPGVPEGGQSTLHHGEDHRPGKRSWQFKAGLWQFRLIRNMVYRLCC